MRFTTLQENLHKALQDSSKFVLAKPQLPILASLLIQAKNGQVTINATNLHAGAQISVGGKVEEEGACTVPSRAFLEYVSSLSVGKLDASLEEGTLIVKSGRSVSRFQSSAAEEFPAFPELKGSVMKIPVAEMTAGVEMGGMAAGTDETRPVLSSVLIEGEGDKTVFVSTDGYRLSRKEVASGGWGDRRSLLPSKTLREVVRIIGKTSAKTLEITVSEELGQLVFSAGDDRFYMRAIEGSFPDYNSIVPKEFSIETSFGREEMLLALRRAMIFSREASSVVKLSIGASQIELSASSSAVGEHIETIAATRHHGEDNEIAFNGKYIQEFLANVAAEQIVFRMNESLKPGMFLIEGDASYYYLAMPFRLQGSDAAAQ